MALRTNTYHIASKPFLQEPDLGSQIEQKPTIEAPSSGQSEPSLENTLKGGDFREHTLALKPPYMARKEGMTCTQEMMAYSSFVLPPVVWSYLEDIRKMTCGGTDGAYLLTFSESHPRLVLKCAHDAAEQGFASILAKHIGLVAPAVRVLPPDSDETSIIKQMLKTKVLKLDSYELASLLKCMESKPILLLEFLRGNALMSSSLKIGSNSSGDSICEDIGNIAAFDLVIGNVDRFENFSPTDILGGGGLSESFNNIMVQKNGSDGVNLALIDSMIYSSSGSSGERRILSTSEDFDTITLTPNEVIESSLREPHSLSDYIGNNVMQMLAQRCEIASGVEYKVQECFARSLKRLPELMKPRDLEGIRCAVGIDDLDSRRAIEEINVQIEFITSILKDLS